MICLGGLKNGLEMLSNVYFSHFIIDQLCFTYNKCYEYDHVGARKPVLGVEYCDTKAAFGEKTQDPTSLVPL